MKQFKGPARQPWNSQLIKTTIFTFYREEALLPTFIFFTKFGSKPLSGFRNHLQSFTSISATYCLCGDYKAKGLKSFINTS